MGRRGKGRCIMNQLVKNSLQIVSSSCICKRASPMTTISLLRQKGARLAKTGLLSDVLATSSEVSSRDQTLREVSRQGCGN
jgi:hypothetical protein